MFAMFLFGCFLGVMYQESFKYERCISKKIKDKEYCKQLGGFVEHVKNDIIKE